MVEIPIQTRAADVMACRLNAAAAAAQQQAGEVACLVQMGRDLAVTADDGGDPGALWRLRALLGATLSAANDLHDAMGQLQQGAAA